MTQFVDIRTQRLHIREFTTDDAPGLSGITCDPDVVRYLSFGPTSPAEVAALVDFAVLSALAVPRTDFVLAIEEGRIGRLVGACGLYSGDDSGDDREVFFAIRRDAWGQGLATEAVGALVAFGFRELGLARVHGVAHPDNAASMRVMERAGMAYEEEVADAFEDEGGWRAGRRYAILAP